MPLTPRSTESSALDDRDLPARRARSQTMDIVRGIAVSGMMLANITMFASPLSIVMTRYWQQPSDRLGSILVTFFLAGKVYSIFSLLFGVGCAMYVQRARDTAAGLAFYLRRMGSLLIIGLLHAAFLSSGDILHLYALLGLVLLAFTRFSQRALLTAAAVCIALPLMIAGGEALYARAHPAPPPSAQAQQAEMAKYYAQVSQSMQIYRQGSFAEITAHRIQEFRRRFVPTLSSAPHILGMMLLGMYVYRRRIFDDVAAHRKLLRRVIAWMLPLGLLLNGFILYASLSPDTNFSPFYATLLDSSYNFGATAFALCYAAAAMLFFAPRPRAVLGDWLAAVGRLALSNYVAQSIVCSFLFLSYGLGHYAEYGPGIVVPWAIGISIVLMALSVWWTRRFQFGPLEWVWRTLSYGRLQPFRVRVVAPA